jgi:hypothetical protein
MLGEHWVYEGEHDPVGLILCSERNEAVAHYALGNLSNTVLAREYKFQLPSEDRLADELAATRRALVTQRSARVLPERD